MRFTKEEKEALLELLDAMTDKCPQVKVRDMTSDYYNRVFWSMFKKVRLEVKGY